MAHQNKLVVAANVKICTNSSIYFLCQQEYRVSIRQLHNLKKIINLVIFFRNFTIWQFSNMVNLQFEDFSKLAHFIKYIQLKYQTGGQLNFSGLLSCRIKKWQKCPAPNGIITNDFLKARRVLNHCATTTSQP